MLHALEHMLFAVCKIFVCLVYDKDPVEAMSWINSLVSLDLHTFPAQEMPARYRPHYKLIGAMLTNIGLAISGEVHKDSEQSMFWAKAALKSAVTLLDWFKGQGEGAEVRPLSTPSDLAMPDMENVCSGIYIQTDVYPLPSTLSLIEELAWRRIGERFRAQTNADRAKAARRAHDQARRRRHDVDEINAYGMRYFGFGDLYQQLVALELRPIDVLYQPVGDGEEYEELFRFLSGPWENYHTDKVYCFTCPDDLLQYIWEYTREMH